MDAVHVTPEPDEPEHRLDGFCWCQPLAERDIDGTLYIHRRSLDSRHIDDDHPSLPGGGDGD